MSIPCTLIPGDGIGPDITDATLAILEAAGANFDWDRQVAGAAGVAAKGTPMPDETLESIRRTKLALKGPLETPIGEGYRSVNVALRKEFDFDESVRVVGLLPGSRKSEVEMLLPVLLNAAAQLVAAEPGTQFILAQASSIDDNLIQALLQHSPVPVRVAHDRASEVMALSDVLFIASGTATLQAAVVGTPMVLLYKTSPLTYRLARWLINVKWIGLVNLVAGRSVVPELIQDEATDERLCQEVLHLLRDPSAYNDMKEGLRQVRQSLGQPGASSRAAQVVLSECRL